MQVRVLYFASLKEQGAKDGFFDLASPSTVAQLKQQLAEQEKKTFLLDKQLLIAVNHTIVNDDHVLNDKDEVAFLPPITGG